jgi:hypothetical protein
MRTLPELKRTLLRRTIWAPELLEEVPHRFRGLFTVALPLSYGVISAFGVAGTLTRVPSVALVTSVTYGDIWTLLIGVTALLALVGLIRRLEGLELYAGIALVVGYATYPLSALKLWMFDADIDRAPLAFGLWAFVILPAWRAVDATRIIRRRAEAARAAKAAGV